MLAADCATSEGSPPMTQEVVRDALLWCTVINGAVLMLWSLLWLLPHKWIYELTGRFSHITPEYFDTISFSGLVIYKMGILFFNLAPYIALRIIG